MILKRGHGCRKPRILRVTAGAAVDKVGLGALVEGIGETFPAVGVEGAVDTGIGGMSLEGGQAIERTRFHVLRGCRFIGGLDFIGGIDNQFVIEQLSVGGDHLVNDGTWNGEQDDVTVGQGLCR